MAGRVSKYKVGMVLATNLWGNVEIIEYVNSKRVLVRFLESGSEVWTNSTRLASGYVKDRSRYRVFGLAINDADYKVETTANGKRVTCPYYRTWRNMLARCYSDRGPTYEDCIVVDEWLTFSNFKAWMETQDWEGKQLDKDLLVIGNKEYGPNTCIFISSVVNHFVKDKYSKKGNLPLGVIKHFNKYVAQIFRKGDHKYLGIFYTPEEAHAAYWEAKRAEAVLIIDSISCVKTKDALLRKYG